MVQGVWDLLPFQFAEALVTLDSHCSKRANAKDIAP